MTTHKIDPALVKSVLRIKYEIDISVNDEQGIIEYGRTDDCNDGTSINIHEFKDKAIEYLAGKGYYIERNFNGMMANGMFNIWIWNDNNRCECQDFDYDRDISIPSAELAAISFAWEQIQKEKKE